MHLEALWNHILSSLSAGEKFNSLLEQILEAAKIGENDDWEFKSAKGGFPLAFWETYSAMANSAGGTIVLGAAERGIMVMLDGVSTEQLKKLKKAFWDQHNNRQSISRGIVAAGGAQDIKIDGGWLLAIRVRQASRQERPIYKGQNPFNGTYKRRHEGDYKCSDEEVRRMLADAGDIPADARILDGFGLEDLDEPTLAAYRNRLSASRPDHAWLNLDNKLLLEQLGGWRRDRENEIEGLTLAGLLMFGKHKSIVEPGAAPPFMVDFRDFRGRSNLEDRWTDRLFPDGTWEANLFQFYQRTWSRLSADLKVPFRLHEGQRIDDSPVHVALREAFGNALIHADYSVGGGIVIERFDESFQFENPGILLVSQEQLRRGGVSECRNRFLQRMFLMIGVGELAGSGFERIQQGWKNQHWRAPRLTEQHGPDRVRLEMPMISLLPKEEFDLLREKIGTPFDGLTEGERIALGTALIEGDVTNTRMQDLVANHSSEITKLLRGLVSKGLLETDNQRRWTRYSLPASIAPRRDLFNASESSVLARDPSDLPPESSALSEVSSVLPAKAEEWKAAAAKVASKGKVPKGQMESAILDLCRGRYLTLVQLAELLNRTAQNLRNTYLTPMVRAGKLQFRYPEQPNRTDQSYTAKNQHS